MRFALSGSSVRKLRSAGVNLLAGRAVRRDMRPFLPEELGSDFCLERILETGSLAIVWASPEPQETLEAYVTTYLREEIQAEALVRNLPGFARFLPIAALFHGQRINASSLARDAEVARTTVHGYIEILQDTLLAFLLPGYEAKLRVKERKHPKLYFVDAGLVRALKHVRGPVVQEEQVALFEGWVVTLVRAYQSYRKICDGMSYWASTESDNLEVDLVLTVGKDVVAIEAKSSTRVKPEHLKGLRAFAQVAQVRRKLLVYRGATSERTADGIDIVPAAQFAEIVARAQW